MATPRRLPRWAVAALGLALLSALLWSIPAGRAGPGDGAADRTVAALPFAAGTEGEACEAAAEVAADLLVGLMSATESVAFVERTQLDAVLAEHELALSGLATQAEQVQAGRLIGASMILTGTVQALEGKLRLDARLLDVESSRVQGTSSVECSPDELLEAIERMAGELADAIGAGVKAPAEMKIDPAPVANLHYMRGMGYFHAGMRYQALAEFMKAEALLPAHRRARFWMGRAYFEEGDYEHAKIVFDRLASQFPKHKLGKAAKEESARCRAAIDKEGRR
jgi:TolA-binding protein